jgi:hypothetical protein
MRRVALVLLPVVFVTLLVAVACGGVSLTGTGLSGTKWKGGNIMEGDLFGAGVSLAKQE